MLVLLIVEMKNYEFWLLSNDIMPIPHFTKICPEALELKHVRDR
jgi:hypothetical protein